MSVDVELVKQIIEEHDRQRPRSLQKAIGPSEIGSPCARRLGYSMTDTRTSNTRGLALPAWIGTAAHEQMSAALQDDPNWLSEVTVELPHTGHLTDTGEPIRGTLDAYHKPTRTVVDWKFLGDSVIKKAAGLNTVKDEYRTQVHLYAFGLEAAGHPVETVAVAFIPRSGNPQLMHVWSEDYDPGIAEQALSRLAAVRTIARGGHITSLPTADQGCRWCPWYLPAATELHLACPGHVDPPPSTEDQQPPVPDTDGTEHTTNERNT